MVNQTEELTPFYRFSWTGTDYTGTNYPIDRYWIVCPYCRRLIEFDRWYPFYCPHCGHPLRRRVDLKEVIKKLEKIIDDLRCYVSTS